MRWSNAFMFNAFTFYFKEEKNIMKFSILNGIKTYVPNSRDELIDYAVKKSTLIAVNTEKILNASKDTQNLINENIGYPDGVGAVWL